MAAGFFLQQSGTFSSNSHHSLGKDKAEFYRVVREGQERATNFLVPAAGVEPATFRSGGERSNPLSYAGLNKIAGFKEVHKKCTPFLPLFVPLVNNGGFGIGRLLVMGPD